MVDKDFCTETKLVGVTKCNDRGVLIQSLLPSLKEGDRLILIRDCDNQYDENAIKVYVSIEGRPQHIGYISASLAENISPFLEENPKYDIEGVVRNITGGTEGKSYGCNITIWIQDPDEPSYEELHAFARNYNSEKENVEEPTITEKTNLNKWIIAVISFVIVLFVFITVIDAISKPNKPDDSAGESSLLTDQERGIDEHLITLNEYNQLRKGMYRSDVYDIVGSFGDKLSETGNVSNDSHIEMYTYEGYGDTGANAQLMFVNGKLDTMAQYGLENYYGKEYGGGDINDNAESIPEKDEPEISLEDFTITFKKLSPDIIGHYRMTVQYENKSKYTVNFALFIVSCNGEEMLFHCDEQVKPNDKSEVHESITSSEKEITSYDIKESTFNFETDDGEEYYFVYDYNTKESSVF